MNARHTRWAWLVIGLAVSAVVVVVLYAILTTASTTTDTRDTQQSNAPKIDYSAKTLRVIEGCTTPGRKCYERGQAQTAKAVGDISQANALAAAAAASCANDRPKASFAVIYRCTVARVNATVPPRP